MRAALAAFAALTVALVVLTAAAPHVHDAAFGSHACVACAAAGADAATCETPDLSPRALAMGRVAPAAPEPPVTGAPLGAVPGQSPPSA